MLHIIVRFSCFIILGLAIGTANSQQVPAGDQSEVNERKSPDGLAANVYRQSSALPDEIALMAALGSLGSQVTDPEDQAFRLLGIKNHLGLSDDDANSFLSYMMQTWEAYNTDLDALKARMACSRYERTADDVYALFDAMHEAKLALLRQYLAIIRSDLDVELYERFHDWLKSRKLGITYWTSHHKKAYEAAGINAEAKIESMCERLEGIDSR